MQQTIGTLGLIYLLTAAAGCSESDAGRLHRGDVELHARSELTVCHSTFGAHLEVAAAKWWNETTGLRLFHELDRDADYPPMVTPYYVVPDKLPPGVGFPVETPWGSVRLFHTDSGDVTHCEIVVDDFEAFADYGALTAMRRSLGHCLGLATDDLPGESVMDRDEPGSAVTWNDLELLRYAAMY